MALTDKIRVDNSQPPLYYAQSNAIYSRPFLNFSNMIEYLKNLSNHCFYDSQWTIYLPEKANPDLISDLIFTVTALLKENDIEPAEPSKVDLRLNDYFSARQDIFNGIYVPIGNVTDEHKEIQKNNLLFIEIETALKSKNEIHQSNIEINRLKNIHEIKKLYLEVNQLANLATQIEDQKISEEVKLFRDHLVKNIDEYLQYSKDVSANFNTFKMDFLKQLHAKEGLMSKHQAAWKPILANIILALTGVGLLFMAGKLFYAGVIADKPLTVNRAFLFGQTNREQQMDIIEEVLNDIRPDVFNPGKSS